MESKAQKYDYHGPEFLEDDGTLMFDVIYAPAVVICLGLGIGFLGSGIHPHPPYLPAASPCYVRIRGHSIRIKGGPPGNRRLGGVCHYGRRLESSVSRPDRLAQTDMCYQTTLSMIEHEFCDAS